MLDDFFKKKYVKDIRSLIVENPAVISMNDNLDNLLAEILNDVRTRHVYVVDDNNKLVGSVRLNSLLGYLFPNVNISNNISSFMYNVNNSLEKDTAKDMMNKNPFFVYDDTKVIDMVKIMKNEKINELPVVNTEKQIIGEINLLEVIASYIQHKNK